MPAWTRDLATMAGTLRLRAAALRPVPAAAPDPGGVSVKVRNPAPMNLTGRLPLNKLCELEDWHDPRRVAAIRRCLPYLVAMRPDFPLQMEHRKHWEFAQLLCGLEELSAVDPGSLVLSVGAGHEEPVYELTNHVRWVFATDVYGGTQFGSLEGDGRMLVSPDRFARAPYQRNRLVCQWMDGLDLRYEDGTFDVAFSLSSIEHFGGFHAAQKALQQMARVVRPGGVVAIATECILNGTAGHRGRGLALFTPSEIAALAHSCSELELVEPIDFGISPATMSKVQPLSEALIEARRHLTDYPAIVFEHRRRQYTSVFLFLRKLGG
ncbi:MAG: methyltransferase domain-containing protein [Candidatus Dormibacteria bacterium]|jgi:SAM-dependent methyltransferase